VVHEIVLIIAGAALATYATRFPLMLLAGKKDLPKKLVRFMGYIAPAVLTALIVPLIFIDQGELHFSLANRTIIASIITVLTAYFSKSMLASVVAGMGAVILITYLGPFF